MSQIGEGVHDGADTQIAADSNSICGYSFPEQVVSLFAERREMKRSELGYLPAILFFWFDEILRTSMPYARFKVRHPNVQSDRHFYTQCRRICISNRRNQ